MTTRKERLDILRRDLLMIRHDVAQEMLQNGADYVTRYLDTAAAALEVEVTYLEAKGDQS